MCLAVPGKLLTVTGDDPLRRAGRVSFGGIVKEVNLACVPEATVGDYVIVHVGLAISIVDETEASRTLEYLREMGELDPLNEEGTSPTPSAWPVSPLAPTRAKMSTHPEDEVH